MAHFLPVIASWQYQLQASTNLTDWAAIGPAITSPPAGNWFSITNSTVMSVCKPAGSLWYLSFCCCASALGGLLFGYDLFVISGAKDLIVQHFGLSTLMEGWFVSSAMVGAMLGCLLAGTASDRFGRKKVLVVASVLLLACSVGCGLAWSAASLIFFRWIGGVGVGIASMVCPLYISEISPARLRGRMVTLFQLAICLGIVAAIVINTGLLSWHDHFKGGQAGGVVGWMVVRDVWRSMLGMESLPALFFFVTCLIIAESPRWLADQGRDPEALRILERINGRKIATAELVDIAAAVATERSSLRELLKPGLRRALFMALFLAVVSEFSGITTIWNFGPEIIRGQGIQLTNEMTGMVVIASSLSIFTLVAVWLMDLDVRGLSDPHSRTRGRPQFAGRVDGGRHPEPGCSTPPRPLGQERDFLRFRCHSDSAVLFCLESNAGNQRQKSGGD